MFWIVIARVDLTTEIGSSLEEIFFNSSARGKKRRTKPNSFGRKFCAFKRGQEKSWNKNWVLVRKFSTFKSKQKQVEKNTKPFGGKNVLRKKVWVFEWCLVSSQKYTKSFGGKNLALCKWFFPSKVQIYVWFLTRPCSKAQNFFFVATLHSQKIVKEIAYIPTSFQASFKSANFFKIICLLNK